MPGRPVACTGVPVDAERRHDDRAIGDVIVDVRAGENIAALIGFVSFFYRLNLEVSAGRIRRISNRFEIGLQAGGAADFRRGGHWLSL